MYETVEGRAFVPFGEDRRETAQLVVGTADEYEIDQHSIKVVNGGLDIPQELADVLYEEEPGLDITEHEDYDPSDHKVEEVKQYVTDNPDEREAVLAAEKDGDNRVTLVEWLSDTETSG